MSVTSAPCCWDSILCADVLLPLPTCLPGRDRSVVTIVSGFERQSDDGDSVELPDDERETLRKLNSAMLMPIIAKDGLLAVISIGAHLGDLPFQVMTKDFCFLSAGRHLSRSKIFA